MRTVLLAAAVALAGCSSQNQPTDAGVPLDVAPRIDAALDVPVDAPLDAAIDVSPDIPIDTPIDTPIDIPIDAPADAQPDAAADVAVEVAPDAPPDAGCPTVLLAGGTDVVAQGWVVNQQSPATLSYGADYVRLVTTTPSGAHSGGQLLLSYAGAVVPASPFRVQVVMLVEATDPHNVLDSAAAILGSFHPPFGVATDRAQMVYLDPAAVGWADDTQSSPIALVNGAYHSYELSVDAAGVARLSVDGVMALMRAGFVSNGTFALGDQTNDPGVDSALRIRSVTRLCP